MKRATSVMLLSLLLVSAAAAQAKGWPHPHHKTWTGHKMSREQLWQQKEHALSDSLNSANAMVSKNKARLDHDVNTHMKASIVMNDRRMLNQAQAMAKRAKMDLEMHEKTMAHR